MAQRFQHLYDNYLLRPASSIFYDPYRLQFVDSDLFNSVFTNQQPVDVQDEFLDLYPKWIASSRLNFFVGLDTLPNRYLSIGVTQALDDFVMFCLKNKLRLRIYKGEYSYAREVAEIPWLQENIDDMPLEAGDAVVISCPFSATGDKHPEWDTLMETCNKLGIPVFVDSAFFGTCKGVMVNFAEPCIDTVAFSPTKGLNCGNMRTGIAFTKRSGKDCNLDILNMWHHGVHFNTKLAYELMKNFGPDTIPAAYEYTQHQVCEHYGLVPSKTMMFGMGGSEWEHFTRDGLCNRVNIRNAIYELYTTGKLK